MKTKRNTVKRIASRGFYDEESIWRILDDDYICNIGFSYENYPVVIPTIYGREENDIYFHGSSSSRMLNSLGRDQEVCVNVSIVDGIVLARSGFHSSLNYRSVVIFGKAEKIESSMEKEHALKVIMDHMIPGRWEEVRAVSEKELAATDVYKLSLSDASAKIREGAPTEDLKDYELDVWGGVVPVKSLYLDPVTDGKGKKSTIDRSVIKLIEQHNKSHK